VIRYREISKADHARIRKLVSQIWNLERFCSDAKLLESGLRIFLRGCLMTSNYSQIAEEDGEVVGFILGRTDKDYSAFRKVFQHLPATVWATLKFVVRNRSQQKIRGFVRVIMTSYKKLLNSVDKRFDGELVLFVVGKRFQGRGIGKTLMNRFFETCRKKELRSIRVFTDTQCNYGFYDHNGFRRLHELETDAQMLEGTLSLTIFLYEYSVSDNQ